MTDNEKEFQETYAGEPIKQRPELPNPIILGTITLAGPGTQTTVGSAGSASALPLFPTGYLRIIFGKTTVVVPFYAVS